MGLFYRNQHFSEFIQKFPECDGDPEAVYTEALKAAKQINICK